MNAKQVGAGGYPINRRKVFRDSSGGDGVAVGPAER